MINFENPKLIRKYSQRYENWNTFVVRITRRTQEIICSRPFANAGIDSDFIYYYQSGDTIIVSAKDEENYIPYHVYLAKDKTKMMKLPAYVNDLIFEKVDPAIRTVAIKIHIDRQENILYFSLTDDIVELV